MESSKICDQVIKKGFYLLFFLVPLILTPFNYELFEYNKMMLVYFLTTIIIAAWLIKMVINQKILFRRSFLDLPLLIFLISQLLSFFFSIDRHTSLWGYYSRFHGSLLSLISYLLLYWACVSNMDKGKALRSLFFILSSAVLVAGYGILEHFGIDKDYWVQDVQNRVFSTLGQPNWLAAYLVALIPLTWALALASNFKLGIRNKMLKKKLFLISYFLFPVFFICLLYTKSRSGLLGFVAAYLAFWGIIFLQHLFRRKKISPIKTLRQMPKTFFIFTFFILIFTIFLGSPWTPHLGQILQRPAAPPVKEAPLPIPVGGTESGDIRKIVWQGAIDIWRHYPIFGAGPETFAYSYYNFRPREHNDVSEWDFLYNKAHNEYLNFAANTGTIGLGSYLLLIGAVIFWSVKEIGNKKYKIGKKLIAYRLSPIALLAGFASILLTNFFGFSVVVVGLFFFLFPAISISLTGKEEKKEEKPKKSVTLSNKQRFVIASIILLTSYITLTLIRFWYADTLFAKGGKLNEANQYNEAFEKLQVAVQLNPDEPLYHDELAQSAASLAVLAHQQNDASLSAQLKDLAITETDQAITITPRHLNFWKDRTRVFYSLAEIDENYYQEALTSLLEAAEIAPTDAKIFYNLAVLYGRLGQDQTAIETLQKTIELKPNYETARWALALFYEQKGDIPKAKNELEYILEKINPKSKTVKEKLEKL